MDATRLQQAFGRAVRRRREGLGISQEELADRAGLHRTYIGDVERGEGNISFVNIVKLARALRVRPGAYSKRALGIDPGFWAGTPLAQQGRA
jgi:transcriptional regulator with XRE-family HTH domain